MTPVDETLFAMSGTQAYLQSIGKPVLFTATAKNIVLTVAASGLKLEDEIHFDFITFAGNVTLDPDSDFYLGKNFASASAQNLGFDAAAVNNSTVNFKIYGGSFSQMYIGYGGAHADTVNMYFGTGEADSVPLVNNYYLVGYSSVKTVATFDFKSGTVGTLYFCKSGNYDYAPAGDYIVRLGSGPITLVQLTDSGSTLDATDPDYFVNMTRTLIFDGFKGNFKYQHRYQNGVIGNGISNVAFINGASVNITNSSIMLSPAANGKAILYLDSTSYVTTTLGVSGVSASEGAEVVTKLSGSTYATGVWHIWNGTSWTIGTDYGAAMGASVRTEAPYGIRFGFVGSTAALEAMTGKIVTEKGVLIIPTNMLNSADLLYSNENALIIPAVHALSAAQPNQFTGVLVDSMDASDEAWLDIWENVSFTARAYYKLADGSVIYSDSVARSISQVRAELAQ